MRLRLVAQFTTIGLLSASFPVAAQTVTYADEYSNRIKTAGTPQSLGDGAFGERVDLYSGATSFSATDLVLEGKGPPIVIARHSHKADLSELDPGKFSGMGDWDFDIPQIYTIVPGTVKLTKSLVGDWRASDASNQASTARCTYFSNGPWSPPWGYFGPHSGAIFLSEWWRGYSLQMPGSGDQTLLARGTAPGPTSGTYNGVTLSHLQVGCLPSTTNGHPGEGFLVLAPDGTKYFLTHLTYDTYTTIQHDDGIDFYGWSVLPRNIGRMKASRVEDRFGNYINYNYTGDRLTSITGSDGRSVTIQWWSDAPLVQSITTNGRTWTYNYAGRSADGGRLSQVVLPDGSAWNYSGYVPGDANYGLAINGCFPTHTVSGSDGAGTFSYAVTHPAGATAAFSFSTRLRGQSYYPSYCDSSSDGSTTYETGNPYTMVNALVQRTVSGPGIASGTWTYTYEPNHASVQRLCPGTSCSSTTYTDVTDPEGDRTRYIHSTRYGALQGKLLRVENYQGSSTQKQSTDSLYNYVDSDYPYTAIFGYSMGAADPPYSTENLVVTRKTTTVRDGRTFVWEVPAGCPGGLTGYCFDAYGRPTKVIKSSSP